MRPALVVVLLTACGGTQTRRPEPPPPPEAISGYWELADGSGVVMQIALIEGLPRIDAWSTRTATEPEVHFDVRDVAWDGRRLQATFTYPPTRTATRSDLVLVNADRLEGTVVGPYRGTEVWVRTPLPAAPPQPQPQPPTGSASGDTPRTPP